MKRYILDYLKDKKKKIKRDEFMEEIYKKSALLSLEAIEKRYRYGILPDDEAAQMIANV